MSVVAPRNGALRLALLGLTVFGLVFAEIAAILWVAGEIGWWTLVILSATTVLGIYLLQREWRKAWGALSAALTSGQLPSGQLADASLVLMGGVLLVVPGLLTDVAGLLLLLPFTRPFIRSGIAWWASKTMQRSGAVPTVIRGDVVTRRAPKTTRSAGRSSRTTGPRTVIGEWVSRSCPTRAAWSAAR